MSRFPGPSRPEALRLAQRRHHTRPSAVSQRVFMELMRHSDRRLSDHLYTDAALLPVRDGIRALPAVPKLPHIRPQEIVPTSLFESHQVPKEEMHFRPQTLINTGARPEESLQVPWSPKWEKMRDTGFEYAIPTE